MNFIFLKALFHKFYVVHLWIYWTHLFVSKAHNKRTIKKEKGKIYVSLIYISISWGRYPESAELKYLHLSGVKFITFSKRYVLACHILDFLVHFQQKVWVVLETVAGKHWLMIMNCFVVWLTEERRLALFPAGTIVRSLQSRISDTTLAGFEPAQNLSSGLVE